MGPFYIKYLSTKDSFCYFSEKHSNTIKHGVAIECKPESSTSTIYFSVGSHNSAVKDNEIGMSAVYAELFNLEEKRAIYLNLVQYMFPVERCCLVPECKNDYEMLEALGDIIQEILLQQLIVVHNEQKCVIWLTNTMKITATIGNIQPRSPGLLVHLTAVEVLQPPTKAVEKSTDLRFNFKGFEEYFNRKTKKDNLKIGLAKYEDTNAHSDMFRIHNVLDMSDTELGNNIKDPFTIVVDKELIDIHPSEDPALIKLSVVQFSTENSDDSSQNNINSLVVRVIILSDLMKRNNLQANNKVVFVSDTILDHLHINVGAKCLLEPFSSCDPTVNVIQIHTSKFNVPIAVEYFKLFLIERVESDPPCILIPGVNFEIRKGFLCRLKFIPEASYCIPNADFIRGCKFVAKETSFISKDKSIIENRGNYCNSLSELGQVISDLKTVYDISMKEDGWHLENYLIVGKEGTGKTALTTAIASSLKTSVHRPHIEVISCKRIKGKSSDSLQKILLSSILKLTYYQPAILILDDLHVLCQNVNESDAMSPQALQSKKSSELLLDLLDKYVGRNKITIFATTLFTSSLNKLIVSTRGRCVFKNIVQISDLNKKNRSILLRYLMEISIPLDNDVDLEKLSIKTDGYSVQDLHDLVQKIIFESNKQESSTITNEHCSKALIKSSSRSIRTVQLHSSGNRDLSDIGGLEPIKQIIMESIYWPIKHAQIFNSCPLRLQTGILLYGPPGTGKTILAGAVAKQCELRFIAVSGPELLSKYIGASEQSVRDVFERAQRAKPCILFFDEFDSLVPRRGHDNTGVTDRVVNQFLTQLDGIEELSGVFILAATSRPDLLDPALLRPGRLDRQLYCELPDKNGRMSILKTLSKNMHLSSSVDFDEIAEGTNGYSGADIRAVLYSAQLESIGNDFLNQDAHLENKEITQQHILVSIKSTRPSLSQSEKNRYHRIYKQFQGTDKNIETILKNQKVTLA